MFGRGKSDQQLVESILAGGEREQRVIESLMYKDYLHLIDSRVAKSSCSDLEDRKEAYSVAFYRFLRAIKAGNYSSDKGKLKNFFLKMYINACVDFTRKRKRRQDQVDDVELEEKIRSLPASWHVTIEEKLYNFQEEDAKVVKTILVDYLSNQDMQYLVKKLSISPSCLELIRLLLAENFDYKKVAKLRGSTYNSIKASFYKCKQNIKQNLFSS
jgi:DNA-directed RNA polymerase specialized sigma24 family protein